MNVVTILGGPRTDGNTDRLLDWTERALRDRRHAVTRINLAELSVHGCRSCFACTEVADEPGCILPDDGLSVFEKLIATDAIVYATPLFMWGFPAQLKGLIDRSICLVHDYGSPDHQSLVEGKPAALLVACAGPIEGNANLVTTAFDRFVQYMKLDHRGTYIFPHCTDVNMLPNTHGGQARQLARALVE